MKREKKKGGKKSPRKHDPKWQDNTRTARSQKKLREWQLAAELNGFATWSSMMTYIKNEALKGNVTVAHNETSAQNA